MEWVGGTDSAWNEGWMAIADPADDMFLVKQTPTVNGSSRLGGAFEWRGSNASRPLDAEPAVEYSRTATFTFYASGGYVAQAQHFRDFANTKGWNVSFATKASANADVNKLLGAPVIYLWGDGRSDTMLNALDTAGINNALVLLSINHVDQNNYFPNQTYANGNGWSAAVRTHGWVPGIYDIYAAYNSGQTTPPFNGFVYQWSAGGAGASSSSTTWAYQKSDWQLGHHRRTRQHRPREGVDLRARHASAGASLAVRSRRILLRHDLRRRTTRGLRQRRRPHRQPRAGHRQSRRAPRGRVGRERAEPQQTRRDGAGEVLGRAANIHWTEGMFKLGASNSPGGYPVTGGFNVYPTTLCDVMDPWRESLARANTGYQAPLWELVDHDALLSTQHWHLAHNKLIYRWDFADLNAMIRGQAPLLHLAYNGDVGTTGRTLAGATDADTGITWNIKWTNTNVQSRVMQTYNNVCAWQGIVGDMPMINHRILSADGSNNYLVQCSEFSDDGGVTGQGIVVNFGSYPWHRPRDDRLHLERHRAQRPQRCREQLLHLLVDAEHEHRDVRVRIRRGRPGARIDRDQQRRRQQQQQHHHRARRRRRLAQTIQDGRVVRHVRVARRRRDRLRQTDAHPADERHQSVQLGRQHLLCRHHLGQLQRLGDARERRLPGERVRDAGRHDESTAIEQHAVHRFAQRHRSRLRQQDRQDAVRVYFSSDDNNNSTADNIAFFTSNYTTTPAYRPKLEVTYHLP
ncbi:MAG: hypothetical protein QM747_13605 [Nocardioides sp.]